MDATQAQILTAVLSRIDPAERESAEVALPLVYAELRAIAGNLLRGRSPHQTLQPTALVHEAYLRLADRVGTRWKDRGHFLALAAKVMRELLADAARARRALKRGGDMQRVTLSGVTPASGLGDVDIVDLDDLLNRLSELNPRHAQIVELRFLAGLSIDEVAEVRGVSRRTVELDWRAARAWLRCELDEPS